MLQGFGCLPVFASFWLQEQGDLPTRSRILWGPRKVLRPLRCLGVATLDMKGGLLLSMELSSERWPCGSGMSLRGREPVSCTGPRSQAPGPCVTSRARAQARCPPPPAQGEEREPPAVRMDPSPSGKPHRPGQLNGELAAGSSLTLEYRALGKLSSHLLTLPNTRADAVDWVAGWFSMTPCWTGGDRAP